MVMCLMRLQRQSDFPQYVEQIANLDSATLTTDQERLAFYINAYNALAIQGILDGYSTRNYWTKAWFLSSRTIG